MSKEELIIKLLTYINIYVSNLENIINYEIDSSVIRDNNKLKLIDNHIDEIKKHFKSAKLTSLHSNRDDKQKFPVLNTYRQILRHSGYTIYSRIESMGYNKHTGAKITRCIYCFKKRHLDS